MTCMISSFRYGRKGQGGICRCPAVLAPAGVPGHPKEPAGLVQDGAESKGHPFTSAEVCAFLLMLMVMSSPSWADCIRITCSKGVRAPCPNNRVQWFIQLRTIRKVVNTCTPEADLGHRGHSSLQYCSAGTRSRQSRAIPPLWLG